jgi:DNA phosphorothioation-associated putative methyltransferase
VFDYGCGRGGDVERLRRLGYEAAGWDPAFSPFTPKRPAQVVNLGYVVNVIEDADERADTLRVAWDLTRSVLIVGARLREQARIRHAAEHLDGLITSRRTFQKLFTQEELRAWIDATLGVRSIAAAPGIFYVFRADEAAQSYLARRFRRRVATPPVRVSEQTFEAARSLLEPLMEFVAARGRLPRSHELEGSELLTERFGSIRAAFALVRRVTGAARWQAIVVEHRQDLLVYMALAAFHRRPALSALPEELQYDIRDLLGTYKSACMAADELLFRAGDTEAVDLACRTAAVGKLTPEALYVHISTLALLPPLLRVYEGCARALVGTVEKANVLKLNRREARISYLSYPGFEQDPHPPLQSAVVASLTKLRIDLRDYRESVNPPILHRKEALLATDHPLWRRFARLTAQEERFGLYADPTAIGTKAGWTEILAQAGVKLRGHRVLRVPSAHTK